MAHHERAEPAAVRLRDGLLRHHALRPDFAFDRCGARRLARYASGIALKAAVSMMSCYGADPYTLRAAIGPSIGKCCFETDSDVADAFSPCSTPRWTSASKSAATNTTST